MPPEKREVIVLPPQEWQLEEPRPREPIFGEGLGEFIAYISGLAIMFTVIHLFR